MKRKRFYIVKKHDFGFLHVQEGKNNRWRLFFRGNMGNTIANVERNCDVLFGEGFFAKLYKNKTVEEGSPDYSWWMESENVPNPGLRMSGDEATKLLIGNVAEAMKGGNI
jgi:hypothetical protein